MKIKKYIKEHKTFLLIVFLLISLVIFASTLIRIDPDYLWHIKAGEYMAHHGILKTDVFSWYMVGKSWMSHEWLFEIIIYYLRNILGNNFYLVFGIIVFGLLELIFYIYNKKNYLKNIPFTLLWLFLGIIFLFFTQVRPHFISYIFVSLTIYFLYDLYNNEDSKKIYFLPLITIFWTNMHGGSSNLSYLFPLIFLIVGLIPFKYNKIYNEKSSKQRNIKYLVISLICMLCTWINPQGIKMFFYPYLNMTDKLMTTNILEWLPTNLNDPTHYIYVLLVIFVLFTFIFSKTKIRFIDFVLFGITLYLGFKSIRFWPYLYIVMNFSIFNYAKNRELDYGTNMMLMILIVVLFIGIFINKPVSESNIIFLDQEVIDILKKEKPNHLYNMYDYGGELIYNDIEVFIDGRCDLYSKYNYKDYLDMTNYVLNTSELINKYGFDYLLVSERYPISSYLKENPYYEEIYHNKDKRFSLYKKK